MRKLQHNAFYLLLIVICNWGQKGIAQAIVVNNPSSCGLGIALEDGGCDPNQYVVPNPEEIVVNVNNAPGTVLGGNVYLREIQLIINHTWVNDLDISLQSPSGLIVDISSDNGGGDDNYGDFAMPDCGAPTRFVVNSCTSIVGAEPPFTDQAYAAEENLLHFNDGLTNPNGLWTLIICDDAIGDLGTLEYVNLIFEPISCLPIEEAFVTLIDTTSATISWLPSGYCGTTIVEFGPSGFMPGTGTEQIFFGICPPITLTGLMSETTYDVYIRKACPGNNLSENSCPISLTTGCQPAPLSLNTHFDDLATCPSFCDADCGFDGIWRNGDDNQFNWLVDAGGTPTFGTGPADDVSGGGNYIYLETSSEICAPNKTAYLYSNCIQLNKMGTDTCHLSFNYHMFGDDVGQLSLEVSEDGGFNWQTIWTRSGNKGSMWLKAYVGLSQYTDGAVLQFRFTGKEKGGSKGDIALDEIRFYGSLDLGFPPYQYFVDADNDGYGRSDSYVRSCLETVPAGYSAFSGDCNDANPMINPVAMELPCNELDENCNGNADDGILPPPVVVNDTICAGETAIVCATPGYNGFIFWYSSPDGLPEHFVGFGTCFVPPTPLENNGPEPLIYRFYAQESDLFCSSPVLAEAIIVVNPRPDISANASIEICAGQVFDLASVEIMDAHFTGGMLSYHSGSPATPMNELPSTLVSPLQNTTYYYKMTTEAGCSDENNLLFSVSPGPALNFTPGTSFSLCRESDALISVQATGGQTPYQYLWSTGAANNSIEVIANDMAGVMDWYQVTVTDSEGCLSIDSVLVTTTVSVDSVRRIVTNVSACDEMDGSITIIPLDGVSPYDYAWESSNGVFGMANGVDDTLFIANLPQGAYRISITDSSPEACTFVLRSVVVNGPGAALEGIDISHVSCAGASNGEICLDVFGNNPTYLWSNDATNACISNLAGGTYSVTISEEDCQIILDELVVEEPGLISVKFNINSPTCFGGNNGSISTQVFGGTAPYSYLWSNNMTVANPMNLAAGTYTLTLTDANLCVYTESITLTQPQALQVATLQLDHISCHGLEDGAILVDASGGTAPYQYNWNTGSNSPFIINLAAGNYRVTVTDFNGCTVVRTFTVTEPNPITLSLVEAINPLCVGDKNGVIEVVASGGTPPFQYTWNVLGDGNELTGLAVGNYCAIATDANQCPPDTLKVELSAISVLDFDLDIDAPTCIGLSNGQACITPNGNGSAPFHFEWSNGDTLSCIDQIEAGDYAVTIEDAEGCLFDTIVTVNAPQVFNVSIDVFQPSCYQGNDGVIDVNIIQSGVPPITFNWSNGSHLQTLIGISDGIYTLEIRAANGCTYTSDTLLLESPPELQLGLEGLGVIACKGDTTGFIEVDIRGGVSPYTYNWVGENVFTDDIYNIGAGTYRLLVEDLNFCSIDTQFVLAEPQKLDVSLLAEADDICEGGVVDELCGVVNGGVAPYIYQWSNDSTTLCLAQPEPGDYVLTVLDANQCEVASNSFKVKETNDPFQLDTFFIQPISCHGADDGMLTAVVAGGIAPYQFHFSNGSINVTAQSSTTLTQLAPGSYRVTVTDLATGCNATSLPIVIAEPAPLSFIRDSVQLVNCTGIANGAIFTTTTGGTSPYTYIWENSNAEVIDTLPDVTGLTAGIYYATVLDARGCMATLTVSVGSSFASIRDTLVMIAPVSCFGENDGSIQLTVLGGQMPYQYFWSNGDNTQDIDELAADFYTLFLVDAAGCEKVLGPYEVTQPESPIVLSSFIDSVSCFGAMDGRVAVNVSGGTMPYVYEWYNDMMQILPFAGAEAEELSGGTYQLLLTDANWCAKSYFFPLYEPEALDVTMEVTPPNPPDEIGSIWAIPSGGTPGYSYLWNTGETDALVYNLEPGQYQVTVTDSQNCAAIATTTIVSTSVTSAPQRVNLFPNPVTEAVYLSFVGEANDWPQMDLRIFNALGQVILTKHLTSLPQQVEQIDMAAFSSGWYRLCLYREGRLWYCGSFVKE
ncbi:MAG TPA: MopE-related protein [Saprospiraceae bacterium]|nr:MopE-related protein [Saprospiraceae bacterium]HMQ83940.1 MopE-related protein [Saprospiraceae bacterium]